jgi:hypothetical protein
MRVDDLGGPVRVVRIHLGGHEHRAVAERTGVEDRRDLTDDPPRDEPAHPGENLLFTGLGELRDAGVRARLERKLPLHQVEEPLVEVVERDRRAVAAAAHLRARLPAAGLLGLLRRGHERGHAPPLVRRQPSHRAASVAW